ncbi:HD family phosphohydrolase [Listeria aquatica]|nr:HD family phosphohydrolase [Listeria aquatica]
MMQKWNHFYGKYGQKFIIPAILVILMLASYVLMIQMTKPESFNAKLFSVADRTIRSPQTVIDTKKTDEEKTAARESVEDVYTFNRETAQNRVSLINSFFAYVSEVQGEIKEKTDKKESVSNSDKLKMLKDKLSSNVSEKITSSISDEVLLRFLNANPKDLNTAKETLSNEIETVMGESIRESNLNTKKVQARDDIELSSIPAPLRSAAKTLVSYAIVPNETYNKKETNVRKREAAASVIPEKILQGQVIVQEGQIIDRETYRQLGLLNLLDQKMPVKQYAGYALLILVLALILYFFTTKTKMSRKKRQQTLLIFGVAFVLTLILLFVIRVLESANLSNISFLFPAAFLPVILKILLRERYAFLGLLFISVTSLFAFQSHETSVVSSLITPFILLSGFAAIISLRDYSRRIAIFRSGMIVGAFNILCVFFLLLINNSTIWSESTLESIFYAFAGGVGAFILALGLIPLFEFLFGVLTTSRLVELANPNHPLLKRILMRAPGTYHHSMMVANLAETCADKIGANGLLTRVGCFYHDIGKTLRPPYFVENQLQGINPHDRLTPKQSRDIILAHTVDGAEILRENHMPQPIIDIALEHHGTTLLKFFYLKEKEENPDTEEAEFRYSGPKPKTKEAAIINIADSVEAAVRAAVDPTKEKIKQIIDGIIRDRILDGQFSECDISLKEIEQIRETLNQTLNGIYHQRIQYPDEVKGEN